MDRERRLDVGEGRDDDAPDPLHCIEGEQALVALGDHPHHRGLAAGPEGGAGGRGLLDGDQPVDDPAALHQEVVHRRIDAVDVGPEGGEVGGRGRRHGFTGRSGGKIRLTTARARRPGPPWRALREKALPSIDGATAKPYLFRPSKRNFWTL